MYRNLKMVRFDTVSFSIAWLRSNSKNSNLAHASGAYYTRFLCLPLLAYDTQFKKNKSFRILENTVKLLFYTQYASNGKHRILF